MAQLLPTLRALVATPEGRNVLRDVMPGYQRTARTSPKNLPKSTAVAAYSYDGKVGKADARMYRHWSIHSEWVRGAVNIRRAQVSSAEWDIVPYDKNKPVSVRLQRQLRRQFMKPNPANDSFRSFIEPIVEDIIVLDAGVVEKERTLGGSLVNLWPVDGATIKVDSRWDGNPDEARYYWYPDYKERAAFKSDDMIYMMANPRTNSVVGLSGLETLKQTIEAELYGHQYNTRQVTGAAPDGVLDLGEGMTEPDVRKFRAYFENEVAGRGAVGFIGGSKGSKWIPFRSTNRDMQFLEWQIYLVRKIAIVLGLTTQDLGLTYDINRSTGETLVQISEDRGLRPLMTLLQEYFTQEVIWDTSFGGIDNNLCFRFTALNLKESTAKAAINEKALAGVPWRYLNEARIDEGREPIPGLEGKMIMETPIGAVDISDVPTVREVIEMQTAKNRTPPPAGGGGGTPKDATVAAIEAMAEAMGSKDKVFVDAIAAAMTPREIAAPAPKDEAREKRTEFTPRDRVVTRETRFITDATGRITGKTETEIVTDDSEALAKRAEADRLATELRIAEKAEVERLATELRIAEQQATEAEARQVKRVIEFVHDADGKVIGKNEREIIDAD